MGGFDNVSPALQISIGVIVGIVSTSVQSLGLTFQRKSHLEEDARPHSHRRPPHKRRLWQIGMLLFIISNILGSTVQITTLPLVILSPLQASGLVFNSICATLILSEPFTQLSLIGTILVCIGATLIAAFGAMKEPAHSLDGLLELLAGRAFLIWMGGQAFLVTAILGGVKLSTILRPRLKHTARARMSRGIAYGSISGILSAHCLLLAKSAVELVVRTVVDRSNQFNRWQSWIILLGLLTLAVTQLYYLHRGLKLCSTSVLYPLVFCVYNIIAILDGLIYYKQAARLSVLYACLIALGTIILLSGVLALSWRLNEEELGKHTEATHSRSALSPGIGDSQYPPMEDIETEVEDESEGYADETTGLIQSRRTQSGISDVKRDSNRLRPKVRRRALSEVEEIWGELEDDVTPQTSPRIGCRDEEEGQPGETVDENTSLLRGGKRNTHRKKLARRSYTTPTSRRASATLSFQPTRRPKVQEAIGGWWPMKWWKSRSRSSSENGDADGAEGSNRGDDSTNSGGYQSTAGRNGIVEADANLR